MPTLETDRLVLVPLSRAMMARRVETGDFTLDCPLPAGMVTVHFPQSWPGDALAMFPGRLARDEDEVTGSFTAIERATSTAVGQLGTVGPPDADGGQEIGYGFNPEVWGRGLATEAVVALTAHLRTLTSAPAVAAVTANTAVTNRASERVLEKAGFARVGTGWSEEDGDLTTWRAVR